MSSDRFTAGFAHHLSPAERDVLGLDRKAGDDHYRAYVGPAWRYDLLAALQFQAMTSLGLREYHSLLDVGCGSLRAGRLFIPYLLPGRYFGIEPNRAMLKAGLRAHFGVRWWRGGILAARRPHFDHSSRFDFLCFGRQFDFILAQSIISHTGPGQLEAFFRGCAAALEPQGQAFVTFMAGERDCAEPGWHYPECVTYRAETIAAVAAAQGLSVRPTEWPAMNRQDGSLISPQTPVVVGLQAAIGTGQNRVSAPS